MLRAVIIDDELPARDLVKFYLKENNDILVVGEADNGFDGAKLIHNEQPDLVFLDIQMPKINGFEMLELLDEPPSIIFCTAYDEYAIKAFELNAVDYLLKPFSRERIDEAIGKVIKEQVRPDKSQLEALVESQEQLDRIVVKTGHSIDIIDVTAIHFLEAQDDYVEIHAGDRKLLKQQTMKYYEHALDNRKFVRVHRRFIVNVDSIAKLDKLGKETYLAQLKGGQQISVSAAGYSRLKEVLDL